MQSGIERNFVARTKRSAEIACRAKALNGNQVYIAFGH